MDDIELTDKEERAIAALQRLAKRWPRTIMLFSQSGSLQVRKYDENHDYNQDRFVADINIPSDGGDSD